MARHDLLGIGCCVLWCCVITLSGCGDKTFDGSSRPDGGPPGGGPPGGGYGSYGPYGDSNPAEHIQFDDDVATNSEPAVPLTELKFTDLDGKPKQLQHLLGEKNLVVVLVRGMSIEGSVPCPYCATQTSRLITNYEEFKKRNAEVVIIYPLAAGRKKDEMTAYLQESRRLINQPGAETPFPVWLDVDLQAVDQLGLRAQLAKPTTYILDKQGRIRLAYVGENMADRPSIKAMLAQLDSLK